jgi:hypothetical protein
LKQVIKDLALAALGSNKASAANKGVKPQVDVDLSFFQTKLIPKLHKTLISSVKQEASAPLFNLIFAMRMAL